MRVWEKVAGLTRVCGVRQVYDVTDRGSFDNVKQWLVEIERCGVCAVDVRCGVVPGC